MNSGPNAALAPIFRLPFLRLLLLILLATALSGCAIMTDFEAVQEGRSDLLLVLSPGQTLEMRFTARRPALSAVQLWLSRSNDSAAAGGLNYRLLLADSREELSAGTLSTEALRLSPQTLPFEIRRLPANSELILLLTPFGQDIQVFGKSEEASPLSEFSLGGERQTGDLAFRQQYRYDFWAALADLKEIFRHAWLILPLLLVFWLPGHLLLTWLERPSFQLTLDDSQRLGLALGLSMAFWPVLLLWTTALHLHWGTATAWAFALGLAALAIWRWSSQRRQSGRFRPPRPRLDGVALALLTILCFTGFTRFAMVRDLAAPAWVDSVHHALLTRLTLEQGGFPESYAPYLPGESATYHPGFHGLTAMLLWLSGLELSAGLQLTGQAMNAAAVLGVYLFAWTFTRSRPSALSAALIAGLLSPMPAYYASWGRFTQLSGLLVLPTSLALLLAADRSARRRILDLRLLLLAGLSLAGLLLLHYRVLLFTFVLLFSLGISRLLTEIVTAIRQRNPPRLTSFLAWLQAGLIAIWLSLPWWLKTFPVLAESTRRTPALAQPFFYDFNWRHLTAAGGTFVLALAGLGWLLALLRGRPLAPHLLLWTVLLFTLANAGALGLPGNGWVNNTSVTIALFFPLSACAGDFLGQAFRLGRRLTPGRWRTAIYGAAAALGTVLALWGAARLLPLINPTTVLFRFADRPAMDWIAMHTPADAGVLINPFYWGYDTYAGSDGGFWIAPLAGRRTIPPPVILALSASPEEFQAINALSRQALELAHQPEQLRRLMQQAGLQYLYIGARGGAFSAAELSRSPAFILRFQQAGTYLFEALPER